MKELSIEEKAKRYDEAIERANELNYVSDKDSLQRRTIEHIFPELKDSDDERVRRELIKFVKSRLAGFPQCEKFIAWLEKLTFDFKIELGNWYKCLCDYTLPNGDIEFKYNKLYYCRSNWRLIGEIDERNVKDIGVNGYKSFFRPATNQEIKDWLEKQGEQKPILDVEIPFGAKDSELQEVTYDIPEGFQAEINGNKVVIKRDEHKPTDDIERKYNPYYNMSFEKAQEYISNRGFDIPWTDCDVFVDFRYVTQTIANILCWADNNPKQKPAKWSEEDEKMLNLIIARLHSHPNVELEEYSKEYDWLDYSLKSIKERYTWKPSEGQMKALQEAIIEMGKSVSPCSIEEFHEIQSLYCNLKKLTE